MLWEVAVASLWAFDYVWQVCGCFFLKLDLDRGVLGVSNSLLVWWLASQGFVESGINVVSFCVF